ncbi:hypothetical protein RHSIM_Rhsim11G0042800 [Rhododendron simsii]|uniref:Uncharacterized protein n=1 Tax=Rhododendron simsii TaxID=118357 RepID=A0A834G7Y3_RHOSS|nr:hypothetical protein RHSIM_Rhsim11G0042800 [Rhododendron simsii]
MRAHKIAQPTGLNIGDLGRRFRVTFKLSDCEGEGDGVGSRLPTTGARSTLAFRAGQASDLCSAATTSGHGEYTNYILVILVVKPPYKIPRGEERDDDVVTFVLDAWCRSVRSIENFLQNKPPVDIAAPPLAQEPPPASGLRHVPPPLTPQARHCHAYDVRGLLHQLAHLPPQAPYEARSTPNFRLCLMAMVSPSDLVVISSVV